MDHYILLPGAVARFSGLRFRRARASTWRRRAPGANRSRWRRALWIGRGVGRTLVYVERNPVCAKLVRVAWQYAWSSAAAHVRRTDPTGLLDLSGWAEAWSPEGWKTALREREDEAEVAALRLSTHRGRPLATDAFLAKLERRLGRRLRPLPVGRPRKPPAKEARSRKRARKR